MSKEATKSAPAPATAVAASPGKVQAPARQANVNTANLKSSYCNMCSVNATREEVVINFGVNEDWERAPQNPDLSLEHRVVLNPVLAKRLVQLLSKVVEDYETRHGALG
ncbi:MAG: DUF3467 domain-containing protein [Steroidobacteraceae bacterium]